MEVALLGDGMAARVTGVDLSQELPEQEWGALLGLWRRHHALIFPDQQRLCVEAHVAFLSRFGPVLEEREPGEQHSYVTNTLGEGKGLDDMYDGYREGELTPHMDFTYTRYPADVISLFAEAVPEGGTHTRFYSNVRPLERMPEALVAELRGYTIRCVLDLANLEEGVIRYLEPATQDGPKLQRQNWPLIRRHPHKPDVEVLFCTLQQTECILELSEAGQASAASRSLLGRLFDEHLYVSANAYEHDWREGDLLVWDNLAHQHSRRPIPLSAGARTFRRVAVCAGGNGVQETVDFLGLADTSATFA
jgi:taurine dioxygenase